MVFGKAIALSCVTAAVVVLTTAGIAGGRSHMTTPTLRGTVGPGFTITLTKAGKRVTRVAPGLYKIIVSDRSSIHNFVVEKSGGAVERQITTVGATGTRTITIRLTRGKWEFYCAPHESTMHGQFMVG